MAVNLSHTHLSVCSVLLSLRACPRATAPLSPIPFLLRLCLDNMKIQNFIVSKPHVLKNLKTNVQHEKIVVIVIVKSELLNLRSHVTAKASLPALEYMYHSTFNCVGNTDQS